jgi:Flp pilus assembly protein TadG
MRALKGLFKPGRRPFIGTPTTTNHQRGAMLPMFAMALIVMLLVSAVVVGIGNEASKRTHAQSAVDATALAGAAGGRDEAVRMAQKYSADLLTFSVDGTAVSVVLLVDGIRSFAHAERHLVTTGRG